MEPDGSGSFTPRFHPNEAVLLLLSDLAGLYEYCDFDSGQRTQKRRDIAASRKLMFYAARVVCIPTVTLRVLAGEVLARSKLTVLESGGGEQSASSISACSLSGSGTTPVQSRLIIEEL